MLLLDELKVNFKIEDDLLLINNYRIPLACFESCDDLSTLKIMSKNILSLTDQNTYNELLPFIKKIKNEKPKILINDKKNEISYDFLLKLSGADLDEYINARKEYIADELVLILMNTLMQEKNISQIELDRLSYDVDVYDQSTLKNTGKTRFKDFL